MESESHNALSTLRRYDLEPVDLHELALEWRGNVVGNRVRACARITNHHLDNGIVDRRKIVNRELEITQHAEEDHRQSEDCRHHRPPDEWFGEIHDFDPFPAVAGLFVSRGCSTSTLPPGVTPSCPLVTICSPAATPF